jgi:hypothetical protein
MRGGSVLPSVRRTRIITGFIIVAMFALFAFGLILIVKGCYILVCNPMPATFPRFNQFMDGYSELAVW